MNSDRINWVGSLAVSPQSDDFFFFNDYFLNLAQCLGSNNNKGALCHVCIAVSRSHITLRYH